MYQYRTTKGIEHIIQHSELNTVRIQQWLEHFLKIILNLNITNLFEIEHIQSI